MVLRVRITFSIAGMVYLPYKHIKLDEGLCKYIYSIMGLIENNGFVIIIISFLHSNSIRKSINF